MLSFPSLFTAFFSVALAFFCLGACSVSLSDSLSASHIKVRLKLSPQLVFVLYIAFALAVETAMRFSVYAGYHGTIFYVLARILQLLLPALLLFHTFSNRALMKRLIAAYSIVLIILALWPGLLFSSQVTLLDGAYLALADGPLLPAASAMGIVGTLVLYIRVLMRLRAHAFFPGLIPVVQSVMLTLITMLLLLGYAQLMLPDLLPDPVSGAFLAVWYGLMVLFSAGTLYGKGRLMRDASVPEAPPASPAGKPAARKKTSTQAAGGT